MRFGIYSTCIAAVALLGCGGRSNDGVVRRAGEPDYVQAFDEAAMDRAISDARASWQQFARALANPSDNMTSFSIKKGFRVGDDAEAEHIWLTNVSFDGERFTGEVNNEPVDTTEVRLGDIVQVTPEQLSDWMYVEDGLLRGGYTIRVLVENSSPEERAQFLEEVGFRIE
jgi:uncharacterized protein YegJ (DUF2314 family)